MPLQDHNDHTAMSRAQLAERIRQMEATAHRNSSIGSPNERHRPMEDRRRREKIARYKDELERRERMDAYTAAADARAAEEAAAVAARARRQSAHDSKQPHCSYTQANGHQCGSIAIAALDSRPACAKHGAEAAADRYAAAQMHAAAEYLNTPTPTPAPEAAAPIAAELLKSPASVQAQAAPIAEPPTPDANLTMHAQEDTVWYTDTPINYDALDQMRADDQDRAAERQRQRDRANEMQDADLCMAHEADRAHRLDAAEELHRSHIPDYTAHKPTPVIPAPPSPRLAVPCPQCHAAIDVPCTNYKGQRCHPHGARKLPAQAAAEAASQTRRATVAAARRSSLAGQKDAGQASAPTAPAVPALPELDRAVEQLVRQHTCGAVLDATWAAARRLFHPVSR